MNWEGQEIVFIYALCDPRTKTVRYIGKTKDPNKRLTSHLKDKKRCRRTAWISSLRNQGLTPTCEIIDFVPLCEWQFWEREYIRVFRAIGMQLVNGTDGGDGMCNPSPETRLKLAANKGKQWSLERRAQYSALRKGLKHTVPMSREHKDKLRQAKLGKPMSLSEEQRRKIGLRFKGRIVSDKERRLKSESLKRRMTPERHAALVAAAARPEAIAKRAKSQIGRQVSVETRLKLSAANTKTGKYSKYKKESPAPNSNAWLSQQHANSHH